MSKIERIELNLNRDNALTKIEVSSATSDDIELLCSELARCCDYCSSPVITKSGDIYHLIPAREIRIDNISETYEFIHEQLSELVEDICFVQDKAADITLELMEALQKQLTNMKSNLIQLNQLPTSAKIQHQQKLINYDIERISMLINYIDQENWDCCCEGCRTPLLLSDILITHDTFCFECQKEQ